MRQFPPPIQNLMAAFSKLPGVGPKTALRFVYYLLRQPKYELEGLAKALTDLQSSIGTCQICQTYSTEDVCEICGDKTRDPGVICVVAEPRDISTIESTSEHKGLYHVLGGHLNPIEGITPSELNINNLISRIKSTNGIREIILAFNPDVHGETTIMYLSKIIKPMGVTTTRLARGLPMGSELEFADEVTLGDALRARWDV